MILTAVFGAQTILYLIALICFFIAAIGIGTGRVNLIALGLFFFILALMVG